MPTLRTFCNRKVIRVFFFNLIWPVTAPAFFTTGCSSAIACRKRAGGEKSSVVIEDFSLSLRCCCFCVRVISLIHSRQRKSLYSSVWNGLVFMKIGECNSSCCYGLRFTCFKLGVSDLCRNYTKDVFFKIEGYFSVVFFRLFDSNLIQRFPPLSQQSCACPPRRNVSSFSFHKTL